METYIIWFGGDYDFNFKIDLIVWKPARIGITAVEKWSLK